MFSDTPVQSSIKVWLKRIKHSNSQLTFDNVTVCCSHIVISSMSAFWKKERNSYIHMCNIKQTTPNIHGLQSYQTKIGSDEKHQFLRASLLFEGPALSCCLSARPSMRRNGSSWACSHLLNSCLYRYTGAEAEPARDISDTRHFLTKGSPNQYTV